MALNDDGQVYIQLLLTPSYSYGTCFEAHNKLDILCQLWHSFLLAGEGVTMNLIKRKKM